jgi:multidrug efflux pump subunit AcrA (membrane-fusion protein)
MEHQSPQTSPAAPKATATRAWVGKVALAAVMVVLLLGAGLLARSYFNDNTGKAAEPPGGEEPESAGTPSVDVIAPKLDPNYAMSVSQPAYVTPYYQIDLRARVAGTAEKVTRTIGARVKEGEVLVTIKVPDLVADVTKKEAIIAQRQRELEVARALQLKAQADIKIAKSTVKVKRADLRVANATTEFRRQELERFRGLARDGTVTENIVAEREKFYEAARAASMSARAAIQRAQAEQLGAEAKLEEAIADEKLKKALVDVAKADRDLAKELVKYATLRAPFDGVVTRRNIDPGSFVQNSTSGSIGPGLLTIEQTEVVTIYTNLPDNWAPYIDEKTVVVLEMTELPGIQIRANVTRWSRTLQNPSHDRTMRVEVDLYNRGAKSYKAWLAKQKDRNFADVKDGKMPTFPDVSISVRQKLGVARLLPGMYGTMKVELKSFKGAYLIPTQAVFTKGGKSFIFVVQGGKARLTPVEVQVEDGRLSKVVVVESTGRVPRRRELTGHERIVLSNQGELTDGQQVNPRLVKW